MEIAPIVIIEDPFSLGLVRELTMRQTNYRNFACVIGLAVGLSLIGAASTAQADDYLRDENGVVQTTEDGLSIIQETMTVSARRETPITERLRQEGVVNFMFDDSATQEAEEDAKPRNGWFFADAGV